MREGLFQNFKYTVEVLEQPLKKPMTLQQKFRFVDQFNSPDTVVIVASFPGKIDRSIAAIDAIASYTDHLSGSLRKELGNKGKRLIIIAQKIQGQDVWYQEKNMLIIRAWDKNSIHCFTQILAVLGLFSAVKQIIVQFEFHQFGGNKTTAIFPLFLAALRLMRKSVVLVMHQVVVDLKTLSGHINITPSTIKYLIFQMALRVFYIVTSYLPQALVVHNMVLKERLTRLTKRTDIHIVPHGLGAITGNVSKVRARTLLHIPKHEFVVMSFGFIAWYKGTDWIAKTFANKKKSLHARLVIAGGESPNLRGEQHYQDFLQTVTRTAQQTKSITITGFVEDKQIPLYFAAADLVVLPYRSLMSSSGPLAMTLAFKKPFLMSSILGAYTKDPDFKDALKKTGVTVNDITFPLQEQAFWSKVAQAKKQTKKLQALSSMLSVTRSWKEVSKKVATIVEHIQLAHEGKSAILKAGRSTSYAAA